ncbi:hypothetical protein JXA84_00270 [candidate division WOR-3 bacterium]|nr:hypothetical protein [candidate division WOR-3 bacterium]
MKIFPIILLFFFLFSCSSSRARYDALNKFLYSGNYPKAMDMYDSLEIKDENAISLDYANRGLLLHLAGRYQESNSNFEIAERAMDRFLRSNWKQQITSFIVNEYTLPYPGEDYENVMVNFYKMFNYVLLNLPEDALVECRRIDLKLNFLKDIYEGKNTYTDDAFSRYMAGILYESQNQWDDCFIEYFKSYQIYKALYSQNYHTPLPSSLAEALKRAAVKTGRENDVPELFKDRSYEDSYPDTDSICEFIFILEAGQIPYKEEMVSYATTEEGKILSVALPVMIPCETDVFEGVMSTSYGVSKIELVQNLGAIASISLKDHGGRILVRAAARAGLKYLAQVAGEKIGDEIAGEDDSWVGKLFSGLIGAFSAATEHADLRGWALLPDKIFLGRISLSPEDTIVNITVYSLDRGPASFSYEVKNRPGSIIFAKERIWF